MLKAQQPFSLIESFVFHCSLCIRGIENTEKKNEGKKTRGSIFNFIRILVCRSVSSSSISHEIFVLAFFFFFFFAFHLIEVPYIYKERERESEGKKISND